MSATERVRITAIAAGGAGVGRLADGRAVFVHRTAPGEDVEVRVVERRRRFARAELVTLHSQSADRRPAPCPHYERCGGCTIEHLSYDAQLRTKRDLAGDALRRIGGFDPPPIAVVPSPDEFRYRNRLSITLLRSGGSVRAGFHALHRPGTIVEIDGRCLLPERAVAEALDRLRGAWGPGARRLPPGPRLRLTLRATNAGRTTLLIEGGGGGGDAKTLLREAGLDAVWQRAKPGDPVVLLAGGGTLEEEWRGERVPVGGGIFLQVNRAAAGKLEAYVLDCAGDVRGQHVIDAYAGVGTRARALAARGARITAIELDPDAVNAARTLGGDVAWIEGRVEERIAETLPAELVIVNPPRAGMDAAAATALAANPPRRLLYVSCDPATLARDLSRLAGSLGLRSIRCFDLFPQTSHVETVAELECATT